MARASAHPRNFGTTADWVPRASSGIFKSSAELLAESQSGTESGRPFRPSQGEEGGSQAPTGMLQSRRTVAESGATMNTCPEDILGKRPHGLGVTPSAECTFWAGEWS